MFICRIHYQSSSSTSPFPLEERTYLIEFTQTDGGTYTEPPSALLRSHLHHAVPCLLHGPGLQYASSVTGYISKYVDHVTTTRTITIYHNQIPWLNALNSFNPHFEVSNTISSSRLNLPPVELPLSVTAADVRWSLQNVNPCKTAGPEKIPCRGIKDCAHQFSEVLKDICNTSLSQATVPIYLKTTTNILLPKCPAVSCLNDHHPAALTPIIMTCFKGLVMTHIKKTVDVTVDPHQYAYRKNRTIADAI